MRHGSPAGPEGVCRPGARIPFAIYWIGPLVQRRWIGPVRKAGDYIELSQETADHLIGVIFGRQLLKSRDDRLQRDVNVADSSLGVVLPLAFEAASVFLEFLAIELSAGDVSAGTTGQHRPNGGVWHA